MVRNKKTCVCSVQTDAKMFFTCIQSVKTLLQCSKFGQKSSSCDVVPPDSLRKSEFSELCLQRWKLSAIDSPNSVVLSCRKVLSRFQYESQKSLKNWSDVFSCCVACLVVVLLWESRDVVLRCVASRQKFLWRNVRIIVNNASLVRVYWTMRHI